jgi:hypothetical protein
MEQYAIGGGHRDLANQLSIPEIKSLAIGGSANSRIIRTTLKDSYTTTEPTLYILGLTFVSRGEIPILKLKPGDTDDTSFEGRWTNPQNQGFKNRWEHFWSDKDTEQYVGIRLKSEVYSLIDRVEDLMYKILSMIGDLERRGHKVLIFQQADVSLTQKMLPDNKCVLENPRLALIKQVPNIIHGFNWLAVVWQHEQGVGVELGRFPTPYGETPDNIKHRRRGEHQKLNEYLINYINEFKILE